MKKFEWNAVWFTLAFVGVCILATLVGNFMRNPEPGPDCDNAQYSASTC